MSLREKQSRAVDIFVIPRTKHIASRMLDLPEPFKPVMALNEGSQPVIWVRTGYDLNPRNMSKSDSTRKTRLTLDNEFFYAHC
jgi:hypothetical protein